MLTEFLFNIINLFVIIFKTQKKMNNFDYPYYHPYYYPPYAPDPWLHFARPTTSVLG